MIDAPIEQFSAIKAEAQKAIESIQADRVAGRWRPEGGAVNWADLRCTEVLYCLRDDGDVFWRVVISEAAPENYRFCEAVRQRLKLAMIVAEVVTEW